MTNLFLIHQFLGGIFQFICDVSNLPQRFVHHSAHNAKKVIATDGDILGCRRVGTSFCLALFFALWHWQCGPTIDQLSE
jgi:hypothetical protein